MTHFRYVLLACFIILAYGIQTATTQNATVVGPYHGSFIPDGVGLKKPFSPETAPVQGNQSWTIYCWVRSDGPIPQRTLLAGFGELGSGKGTQRYFALRDGRLSFWTGEDEIMTEAPLQPVRWQLLAATFRDGRVQLYSDGLKVAEGKLELTQATPVIQLAPAPLPFKEATHFAGRIANFTLLPRVLTPDEIRALSSQVGRLDSFVYEAASKSWPVQTKGQDGLRAPQEPATLPQSNSAPSQPAAKAASVEKPALEQRGDNEWALAGGWHLIEAPKTASSGEAISRPGFKTEGWMAATVPGTVLTTFIDRGVYPDPDFGLNNFAIPESLNKQDYWYRTEFTPPASQRGRRFRLTLHGINYAASVWLNGQSLGVVRGAFMRGDFDVSRYVVPGRVNALAVRVSPPPHPGIPHEESVKAGPGPNGGIMCLDGPTFICTEGWDWIPGVRDRATGIWQDVTLKATGPVRIGDIHVVTKLPLPDITRASVSLTVPLGNDSGQPVSGVIEAAFEGVTIRRRVTLKPGDTEVALRPEEFAQLNLDKPRLWWPNGYGSPELYHLNVKFTTAGGDSDSRRLRFGIRELTYELTLLDETGRLRRVELNPTDASRAGEHIVNVSHEGMIESAEGWVASFMPGRSRSTAVRALEDRRASPHLVIRVNGVRIACKGGNWGLDDSRKRVSRERLEPYFRLHRDANLTMIRNWCGQNTEEAFFDLADEYGLLVWNDFWLSTQDWNLEPTDSALFLANARDTLLRFRHHPSIAIWCGRNEGVPPPTLNEGLDELIRTLDGTRYYSPNSRKINLQDSGPWNYGDPFKFFTTRGRGFSTELGLPSPPAADTIKSMLAEADHWPPNDAWAYHDWHSKSGGDVTLFMKAMDEELGPPASLADFERKAQMMSYVSHRAMFEGFNAHLWNPNTGRLMWMTHPAWPSMAWQMYSSDYSTHGAFYGIKKACEPLHVQLNLPNLETAVVNTSRRAYQNLRLRARVLSVKGEELSAREDRLSVPANTAIESFQISIPETAARGVVFVKLALLDEAGQVLSENFYWHAAAAAGYKELNDLATANVSASATQSAQEGRRHFSVELANDGTSVAVALQVVLRHTGSGARLLPAYASDNYVSLLPGEKRRLAIEVPGGATGGPVEVAISGWNVRPSTAQVR